MKILLAAITFTSAFFAADTLGCEDESITGETPALTLDSREDCDIKARKEVIPGMI